MKEQSQNKTSSNFLKTDGGKTKSNAIEVPSISLPKGGGAIKGIDEKFSVNAVNGTSSFSIPLPFSTARGAMPSVSLSYNSGGGNGIFGLGWNLNLGSIKRKTDKGLPQYVDAVDSDTFLFSEAEDLVPEFKKKPDGSFHLDANQDYVVNERDSTNGLFIIRNYKPRIEGLFACIERWTEKANGRIKWRIITKENTTTLFGWTDNSILCNPNDTSKIYEWLPEFVFDDKGNCSQYLYKKEDKTGFTESFLHNRNRLRNGKITYTNLYLEKILYGNITPYKKFMDAFPVETDYMFQTVFDYGTLLIDDSFETINDWDFRPDAFSDYKAGFEIRTTRLCQRVLLFHVFDELALKPDKSDKKTLIKSVNFDYDTASEQDFTFLTKITSFGYIKKPDGNYAHNILPPMEFEYQKHDWSSEVKTISPDALIHAPSGLDGQEYQFTDLFNEGLSGILTEQSTGWYYKHNLGDGKFEQAKLVSPKPSFAGLGGQLQLADLDADGGKQLVSYAIEPKGYFELDDDNEWHGLRSFKTLPNIDFDDPNTRMLDLNGDGKPEVVISEDNVFTWYPSEGRNGYAAARKTTKPSDEEAGPHLVFADAKQTIFLADMSGDGLTDILRIRNGEVCYWPNLGYGNFGAKVAIDNAPVFDHPDAFNPAYLRLTDIDGSGTSDIIYLGRNKFTCWKNLSGNRFSTTPFEIDPFPEIHSQANIMVADLLGNGVACIVWSSPLSKDANAPLKYIDLMNSKKPHIMVSYKNNLGKEVSFEYTPSTKFYVEDKLAGKPWITKLHFPVHLLTKTTTKDKWRNTCFTSQYSYHHGYYDHAEMEFRGFGRVEQTDAEDFGVFASANVNSPYITNDLTLYQPPIKTITWFHTGAAIDRQRILTQFEREYFPRSLAALPTAVNIDSLFVEKRLPEPELDQHLSADEWREALRACKGMTLRQEVYELDVEALQPINNNTTPKHIPVRLYSAATHNCNVRCEQSKGGNQHAVFLVTESEAISYHYELDLRSTQPLKPDPRIAHTLNLSFNQYGNVQQSVVVGYPRRRRFDDASLVNHVALIREVQSEQHIAYSETLYTNDAIGGTLPVQHYRLRVPCEVLTFELTGITAATGGYFNLSQFRDLIPYSRTRLITTKLYHEQPEPNIATMRLVEHARTLFFDDDPTGTNATSRFLKIPLALGTLGKLGLTYEQYKLALTTELLNAVFTGGQLDQNIGTTGTPRNAVNDWTKSGYLSGVAADNLFGVSTAGEYWMRSGVAGFAPDAAMHFYLPELYTDPFDNVTTLQYGAYDLFVQSSTDAMGNTSGIWVDSITKKPRFDYRVLAPLEMFDINGNRSEVCFDVFGLVVASAVKGKGTEADNLIGFDDALVNLSPVAVQAFCTNTVMNAATAAAWLANASARFVYHFGEERDAAGDVIQWEKSPAIACGIVRERHASQVAPDPLNINPLQVSLECSDGSGNVLMKKIQAESAPGQTALRWIINGLTVLNNKGKPVKQYEPAFSVIGFGFELPQANGVTPIIYYDTAGRTIRTEMPDGTFSRVEFSPWHVITFDANDTAFDPAQTAPQHSDWFLRRTDPTHLRYAEFNSTENQRAAELVKVHANTPALILLDSLGREVFAIAHNRIEDANGTLTINGRKWRNEFYTTFTKLDAEGKPLWIRDARGNLVMQYITPYKANNDLSDVMPYRVDAGTGEKIYSAPCYDIAGNLLFQHSMDAGDRWTINDAAGKPMFAWDTYQPNDGNTANEEKRLYSTEYDALHRPTALKLKINNNDPIIVERYEYRDTKLPNGNPNPQLVQIKAANLVGQLVRHYDPSGLMETIKLDFKGSPLEVRRRLVRERTSTKTDWKGNLTSKLSTETFIQITEYDALNRMSKQFNWHRAGKPVAVYFPTFGERGVLKSERLIVGANKTNSPVGFSNGTNNQAIEDIRYDAKGQRQYLKLGNGAITHYDYDPETFRLRQLRTTRLKGAEVDPGFPGFSSNLSDPCVVQQLFYTYDPVGNITEIHDQAYKPVFFANAIIEPKTLYEYDALYRLIWTKGRESAQGGEAAKNGRDAAIGNGFPITDQTLRVYQQKYQYDAVGNFITMQHIVTGDTASGWTRRYQYAFDDKNVNGNLNQPASNRLWRTWQGSADFNSTNANNKVTYAYDSHGSMLNLANVPDDFKMQWDHRDMIASINLGGGGIANYQYDSGKQRTRKTITKNNRRIVEERIYLGGLELYRRVENGVLKEEIETLHLFDGEQRLLMVDQILETNNASLGKRTLYRYTLSNHLSSSTVELDDQAGIISYEEYHPYGTSAFRAGRNAAEVKLKRYRYTGMERDEESGLSYHTARYYLPWSGRWASSDPKGIVDGVNLFTYVRSNPIIFHDSSGNQTEQIELVESIQTSTLALRGKEPAFYKPITKYFKAETHSWGLDPQKFVMGHSPSTPQWSSRAGTIQIVSPQTATSNAWQSNLERTDAQAVELRNNRLRAEGKAGPLEFRREARVDLSAPKNMQHNFELDPIVRDFADTYDSAKAEQKAASYLSRNDAIEAALQQRAKNLPTLEEMETFTVTTTPLKSGTLSKIVTVGKGVGGVVGFATDVADVADSSNPFYASLKVTTAATQGTGATMYLSGLAAGASGTGTTALGTTLMGVGGAASLAVSSVALAINETDAALEGRETAIHGALKAVDRLRIAGERESGIMAGLKQAVGTLGTGLMFSLDAAQQGYGHWGAYRW
jgi:RHS repeat-associated protein